MPQDFSTGFFKSLNLQIILLLCTNLLSYLTSILNPIPQTTSPKPIFHKQPIHVSSYNSVLRKSLTRQYILKKKKNLEKVNMIYSL